MAQNNSNLYLLHYNNYYNRIVKTEPTLDAYLEYQEYGPLVCNFNPADGVDTEHVFNLPYLVNTPEADYLIVQSAETNEIVSRWFIVNAQRTRGGQYKLSLHRDLVADYYDAIITAPAFIERAVLSTNTNSFIFNSENMNFSQIKKGEYLLKDESEMGWLVGYVAASGFDPITVSLPESANYGAPPIDYNTLSGYATSGGVYRNYGNMSIGYKGVLAAGHATKNAGIEVNRWANQGGVINSTGYETNAQDHYSDILFHYSVGGLTAARQAVQAQFTARFSEFEAANNAFMKANLSLAEVSSDTFTTLQNMNGVTYSDGSHVFSINISKVSSATAYYKSNVSSTDGAVYTIAKAILDDSGIAEYNPYTNSSNLKPAGTGITVYNTYESLLFTIQSYPYPTTSTTITSAAKVLQDQPYRMFAIPVGSKNTVFYNSTANVWQSFTPNPDLGKRVASTIATLLGGTDVSNIYDLQYLPYCPARGALQNTAQITLWGQEGVDYNLVKNSNGDPLQYLIWCDTSSFNFVINYNIDIPANSIDFKVDNETKFVRICSPNYNGSYEFKPTMNYGVNGFEVYCTYKPFQPYIFVSPVYNEGGLYGGDFNDQRGLVCSGDFSVTILNDNWIDYQIQNKSYADAFDRQVDNMSITYSTQREQQRIAGNINAITAGISGATTGAMVGSIIPGIGTAVGAGAGIAAGVGAGLLSYYGAKKDLEFADALQKEAMSYTKDMYAYNLQNIQALPYTLGKVSAFSINNKIFPFLEFYEATEKEVQALRNKITYHGMTIGAIDNINSYIQSETPSFVSAQIIRLEDIGEDYHTSAAIANEIHKGVYI